jgi:ATP synthase protein I
VVQKLTIPSQIHRILVWQWVVTFFITAVLLIVKRDLALSAFLGGVVCAVPNMYFARQLHKRRIAVAHTLLRSVFVAEFIKLGLAVALLAIVLINYKEVSPVALFTTYLIVHSCIWALPLLSQQTKYQTDKKELNQTL